MTLLERTAPSPAAPRLDPCRKSVASSWFSELRDRLCDEFEAIEEELTDGPFAAMKAGKFERTVWERPGGGGGIMSVMRGRVFEKVGVNVSTVHGTFSPEFRKEIPGAGETGEFWASGVSLVAHMRNPLVPAAHFNTRMIVTSDSWFGGGGDLTPLTPDSDPEAAQWFHTAMRRACDRYDPERYDDYRAWCDRYFYLPHRREPRGAGGIFYDRLNTGHWAQDFAFTRDVGLAFLDVFPRIVRARMEQWFDEADKRKQRVRRGRYVEFNLLYDRGTRFGLETDGNVEAILMSMPPEAAWP